MKTAKNAEGKIVNIDDVLHGSSAYTKCTCIHCGKPVGANKNTANPYFYHDRK